MNDGTISSQSLGINTHFSGGSSVSSGGGSSSSPLNSPLISPSATSAARPDSLNNVGGHFDQLQTNFSNQMTLQPPSPLGTQRQASPSPSSPSSSPNANTGTALAGGGKANSGNTFVHKLYNMVVDSQYQHLIAWTYTGTSFIVCNITEFSRDVLPKHFKHNNFSSFVRQLNMYGFHKVNKSPRGHRTLAENQIWEFSHPKFLRNRADLLDEIKRKTLESQSNEATRRGMSDDTMSSHMAMIQMTQSDMMQKISHLQENLTQVMQELSETRRKQSLQQQMMKDVLDFMTKQYGSLPFQQDMDVFDTMKQDPDRPPPPIFITSADTTTTTSNTSINNTDPNANSTSHHSPFQQAQQQLQPNINTNHPNNQFYLNINDSSSTLNSPLSVTTPSSSPQLIPRQQQQQQQQQQQRQQLYVQTNQLGIYSPHLHPTSPALSYHSAQASPLGQPTSPSSVMGSPLLPPTSPLPPSAMTVMSTDPQQHQQTYMVPSYNTATTHSINLNDSNNEFI